MGKVDTVIGTVFGLFWSAASSQIVIVWSGNKLGMRKKVLGDHTNNSSKKSYPNNGNELKTECI